MKEGKEGRKEEKGKERKGNGMKLNRMTEVGRKEGKETGKEGRKGWKKE